jgi:hypothetical protein
VTNIESWLLVNDAAETVDGNFTGCCSKATESACPIDAFYGNVGEVLKLGLPDSLNSSPTLGRLLALGLVTGTEAYFRSVFLGMLEIGALDYYGKSKIALGLFEGVSFADGAEIKKRSNNILGFSWKDQTSLGVALVNFDTVCHIRHASVHSQGQLNRGNAKVLGIKNSDFSSLGQVVVDFPHLQKIALVCSALVRSYNAELFPATVDKWLSAKVLSGTWAKDKAIFGPLVELFCSQRDAIGPKTAHARYRQVLPKIAARLAAPSG